MLSKELTLPFSKFFQKIPVLVFEILFWAIIGFIFLGCANLFGQQGIFILISIALMLVFVFLKSKLIINWPFILSCAFCLFYTLSAFIYDKDSLSSAFLYSIIFPVFILFFGTFEDKKKPLLWLLIAFIFGLFLSFLLMILCTYWHQGASFNGDVLNTFWSSNVVTRTGLSLYEIGVIGVTLAALFFANKYRKWYTIPLMLFTLLFCFYVSIMVGNRSFLIALFVIIYVILAFKMFQKEHDKFWTGVLVAYSVIFISFFVVYFLHYQGILIIPDELMRIKIINRLFSENIARGRPEILQEFFSKFYMYPFGGLSQNMSNQYAHNLLLDFYTFGGVIPFAIGAVFFVFLFRYLYYFLHSKEHIRFEKVLLTCIIASIVGLGFIEPIYKANPNSVIPLFIVFLYIRSCVLSENLIKSKAKQETKTKKLVTTRRKES